MKAIHPYVSSGCVNPDDGRPLSFELYEYLNQPLRDLSPRIVIQKAAQVGATVLAILRALWFIDARQAHTMYLFPTHRSALRFSRGRFSVLLERSPYLRGLFEEVRNAQHMRAGVANFYCHGARSRTELMSTPVQYLTLDERDELYLGSLTSWQPWSAVELARQRLSGQREAWELNLSTPTIPGHGIAAEFAQSDQHFYHLLCPLCGGSFSPTWPDAVDSVRAASVSERSECEPLANTRGSETPAHGSDTLGARFRCQLCRQPWTDIRRRQAIREGRWIAIYPERTLRGYHLSQLVSPAATASRLVTQWQECQDNPQGRQVFYNSVLGLPYIAEGARLEMRFIEEAIARGGYAMEHSSQGSVMGIDVGPTWFHVVIGEPVADGRTGVSALLRLAWIGKVYEWGHLPELIRRYRVQSYVIDAMPETHQVRRLLNAHPQGYMCYYVRGPLSVASGPLPGGNINDRNANVLRVSRTESLDAMYLRWRMGQITAPSALPAEFVEQMRSLVRVMRVQRDGQAYAEYIEAGGPDHYAHAMNYCELALLLRGQPVRFEVIGKMV